MPAILEAPQEAARRITVRAAMDDQSYARCILHIYRQQIFLIAEKIFLPQLNTIVKAPPGFLLIRTDTEIIIIRDEHLLVLPFKFEFRNSARWS